VAGTSIGYDDLRVVVAAQIFVASMRDREQLDPEVEEMLVCVPELNAIERSNASGRWEPGW
jgi:hypothetical protein